ncbi:MAG: hydrogenase 4 subunit B [Gammaproteobacteria bacterium]|nr:hydrogenase 4 subunit B [Gammaproteobacteria bacterium]
MLVYAAVCSTLAGGFASLFADRWPAVQKFLVFPLLGLSGVVSIAACLAALSGAPAVTDELALGLPWLQWHVRLDSLSGFFLGVIGLITLAVSAFGPGYVREYSNSHYSLALLGVMTALFVAGMQLVVVADDAFAFMVAWELMSVASYFLVAFEHEEAANRRAAFLYLLMAQVGAILILLSFGVLAAHGGDFTFAAMRHAGLTPLWAAASFGLGLLGFGMKAGIVPLHVWLPEAHPVAPSHISALMSGVMLKVAVYGFIRLVFDLLGDPHWSWGVVVLAVGSVTSLYGVLYALVQHDLKRLLAYHSVENIGIIYIGLGLALIFFSANLPAFGVLGLIAALYHTLNHALFKSLLFLGAGALLQHGHERDLEHMGGLIRRMPWTALFFLIGCLSISALPPFNGFVSEWLTFQTALQATTLESGVLRAVIPISAAVLALSGALAATCFVKVYGVAFLGQARSRKVRHAREASHGMVLAQAVLACLCLLFGVLPTTTVEFLSRISVDLTGFGVTAATRQGWLWLTPIAPEVASYSAPLVLLGVLLALGAWAAVYFSSRKRRLVQPLPRRDAWDCGFGPLTPRMQYSASAFAMPIRHIFRPAWRLHEEKVREMDPQLSTRPLQLRYLMHADDLSWQYFYLPVERFVQGAARRVGRIQTGHLRHYLAYSFFTLIALLWLIT